MKKRNIIIIFAILILITAIGFYAQKEITGHSIFSWIFGGSQEESQNNPSQSFMEMPIKCEELSLRKQTKFENTYLINCKIAGFKDLNQGNTNDDFFQTKIQLKKYNGKELCYVDHYLNMKLTSFCVLDKNNAVIIEGKAPELKNGCKEEKELCNKARRLKKEVTTYSPGYPGADKFLEALKDRCKCHRWEKLLNLGPNVGIKHLECKSAFYIGEYSQFGNSYGKDDLLKKIEEESTFTFLIGGMNGTCLLRKSSPPIGVKCYGGFACNSLDLFKKSLKGHKICCSYKFGNKSGECETKDLLECISEGGDPHKGTCKMIGSRGTCNTNETISEEESTETKEKL